MQMEVHIYLQMEIHTLKLRAKQLICESRYNDNIKGPKPQDTQLGILKITYIKANNRSGGPIWNYATETLASWY